MYLMFSFIVYLHSYCKSKLLRISKTLYLWTIYYVRLLERFLAHKDRHPPSTEEFIVSVRGSHANNA